MGYEVHITRKKHWSEKAGPEISLPEWLGYLKSDPEMRVDGSAETKNPKTGEVLRYENAGLAVWECSQKAKAPWFDYHRGRIVVKNPDSETLAKMWRVAQALSAKVQGDEGEIYDQSGTVVS